LSGLRGVGDYVGKLAISANKGAVGQLLGAAGAISGLSRASRVIRNRVVPPTSNLVARGPECDLYYVPNSAHQTPVNAAANGFSFGGQGVCAIFRAL